MVVSAPAGYGKTAMLASWAREQTADVAWLSCDAFDADPARFVACLFAAISSRWPGAVDDAVVLLERHGEATHDAMAAAANGLMAAGAAGVIVVDDLHLATPASPMLAAFVAALPDQLRLVIGTRSDPLLPLARLRVRGELLELRSDQLRFTRSEQAAFLADHGVVLDEEEMARLHELTEGWPAGVQMAAIALQDRPQRGDFLDAFASTERDAGDFLLNEVLASLSPEVVDFLVETSVFDTFDADLCAEVTGVDDAAATLDQLVAANLFVVPLGEPARWFRYHHLFGAFLRARLTSMGRTRTRNAHDRACQALERRGLLAAALRHAIVLDDAARAGEILRRGIARSMSLPSGAEDVVRGVAAVAVRAR